MKYHPQTCVWEVTMDCNMNCWHCGSSCNHPLSDELTTKQGLMFIDMCSDIGLKWITFSGGEPLTRADICTLIEYSNKKGILATLITNGWLMTDKIASNLKKANISTVAISLDGTEQIHDNIRKKGSFARVKNALKILKRHQIYTGCITTITNKNLYILDQIRDFLTSMNVDLWQLQIGMPMGNLSEHNDWVIAPEKMIDIINFCYETAKSTKLYVCPADCIGYFSRKEIEISKIYFGAKASVWDGCNAGIRSFGMLHNGDILGCTSIRDKKFIEGNILKNTLLEIWESQDSFLWRRNFTTENLSGNCSICKYNSRCLGGCTNARLTINKDINSDNKYCQYSVMIDKFKDALAARTDTAWLITHAQEMQKQKRYQEAELTFERLKELEHVSTKIN